MTLKYESEILFDLMKRDGDVTPSDVLPYESELKEKYLNQVEGAYPKLQDYRSEWMNYNLNGHLPADFPVESVSNVTNASFENVVPYVYRSAILKGSTKYRDIDTGDILDTFDETKNLELVSIKMPVLTTTGKNLFDGKLELGELNTQNGTIDNGLNYDRRHRSVNYISVKSNTNYSYSCNIGDSGCNWMWYDKDKKYIKTSSYRITATSPSNAKYLKYFSGMPQGTNLSTLKVQIEESSTTTPFEPHKSNILTVNEGVELRGVGDVKDELDLLTGQVTERIGEIVLNGNSSQNINKYPDVDGFSTCGFYINLLPNFKGTSNFLCDKLKITTIEKIQPNFSEVADEEGVAIHINHIKLRIDGNKATTVEELRVYLSSNPITLTVPIIENIVKTVDLSCINEQDESATFRPIEGTMHVSTSSQTLPPLLDISVPVEATTQNLMSFANIVEEEY